MSNAAADFMPGAAAAAAVEPVGLLDPQPRADADKRVAEYVHLTPAQLRVKYPRGMPGTEWIDRLLLAPEAGGEKYILPSDVMIFKEKRPAAAPPFTQQELDQAGDDILDLNIFLPIQMKRIADAVPKQLPPNALSVALGSLTALMSELFSEKVLTCMRTARSKRVKPLRSAIEITPATKQCSQVIGRFVAGRTQCWICGEVIEAGDAQCEHVFCVKDALMFAGLFDSGLAKALLTADPVKYDRYKRLLKLEYGWAHTRCNQKKSDMSPVTSVDGRFAIDKNSVQKFLVELWGWDPAAYPKDEFQRLRPGYENAVDFAAKRLDAVYARFAAIFEFDEVKDRTIEQHVALFDMNMKTLIKKRHPECYTMIEAAVLNGEFDPSVLATAQPRNDIEIRVIRLINTISLRFISDIGSALDEARLVNGITKFIVENAKSDMDMLFSERKIRERSAFGEGKIEAFIEQVKKIRWDDTLLYPVLAVYILNDMLTMSRTENPYSPSIRRAIDSGFETTMKYYLEKVKVDIGQSKAATIPEMYATLVGSRAGRGGRKKTFRRRRLPKLL